MKKFRITNLDRFTKYKPKTEQHKPLWIQIYVSLVHDPNVCRLPDSTKYLYIGLVVLASQHNNELPFDTTWIRNQLMLSTRSIQVQSLIDAKLIEEIQEDSIEKLPIRRKQEQDKIRQELEEVQEKEQEEYIEENEECVGSDELEEHLTLAE